MNGRGTDDPPLGPDGRCSVPLGDRDLGWPSSAVSKAFAQQLVGSIGGASVFAKAGGRHPNTFRHNSFGLLDDRCRNGVPKYRRGSTVDASSINCDAVGRRG